MKEVEIKKVLSVADEEWRGLIIVGLYTVQRLGDVACLRWRNVDFEQKVISLVTRKGSRRVVVPFKGVKALEDLLNILSSKPHSEDTPLFPKAFQTVETQNGRVGSLSNQFADLLIQAKIRPEKSHKRSPENAGRSGRRASNTVSFHSLRHSGTSMMKNANVPHSIVQDIVGHDSAEISWLYTHVDEAAKAAALRKLPDITR
jgi:integrase